MIGNCSTVRKNNLIGRNYDWQYNTQVSFVVRTPRNDNKFATLGIASSIQGLTKEFMESGEYNEEFFKILPFFTTDAINEYGVAASVLVVPAQKGMTTGTIPRIENRDEICNVMLVRYVVDHFKTAQEAVEYIRDYISVFTISSLVQMNYEVHYMISDKNKSYALEFVNNVTVIKDITSKSYVANFYLDGVTFSEDGKVFTPATVVEGKLPTSQGITSLGSGLERYNRIVENYSNLNSVEDMKQFMCGSYDVPTLRYTQAYRAETTPQWNTEFVGVYEYGGSTYELTVDDPESSFFPIKELVRDIYEHRIRNGQTWQTEHSCVYDLEEKKLYLQVQEDMEWLEFTFNYFTREEVKNYVGNGALELYVDDPEFEKEPACIFTANSKETIKFNIGTVTTYIFEQEEASDEWVINHNLNKFPSITVVDSGNNTIGCATQYVNEDTCILQFNSAFTGKAYLN